MKLLPTSRRHRLLLAAILVAGALLRLWLWWRTPDHQPANDENEYLQVARDLLSGRGWTLYERFAWLRAPLYPLWLAASLWLARGNLLWAALPNIALGVLMLWLLYLLGREVGHGTRAGDADTGAERTGLVSAALASVLLTFATFSALWMAETLFTALLVAAWVALLRWGRRPRYATAAFAGALLGLAILTRSLPLTWLPVAALWMVVSRFAFRVSGFSATHVLDAKAQRRKESELNTQQPQLSLSPPLLVSPSAASAFSILNSQFSIRCALLFALCSILTIAPWTLRNYLAYGSFIAVETGLSFNMWAFFEPREDQDTILRVLQSIPNPAERAEYATAKGLERLREDPAIVLRKLWPNWSYLWRVKPAEDRFLQRTYYEDTPLGMFVLGLVLDDALLYGILLAALGGLLWSPNDRTKLLLVSWLAYVIAVVLLTHGEARYKHFVLAVLLVYAAWLVVNVGRLRRAGAFGLNWRWAAAAAGVVLLWSPLALQYPWSWASRNLGRGWAMQRAAAAAAAGNTAAALDWYARAAEYDPDSAEVWLARGMLHRRLGQEQAALAAFDTAFHNKRLYVPPNVARADSLRRLGRLDEARAAFAGFYTDELEMLRWSWRNLDTPPPSVIEVGDGLDFGFVSGMYAAEQVGQRRVRWTEAQAELRLNASRSGTVRLTLSAPRPGGEQVPVTVCIRGEACQRLSADASWRSYALVAPPGRPLDVSIAAPPFNPRSADPASTDGRLLGVLVDSAGTE